MSASVFSGRRPFTPEATRQRWRDKLAEITAVLTCIYCSCSDRAACVVERRTFDAGGVAVASTTTCSWISVDPPVCSAPRCREQFALDSRELVELVDSNEAYVPPLEESPR